MPDCDSVKLMNTPTAYSGIMLWVSALKITRIDDGRHSQPDDAVGEDQPVAPVHELAGHEAVPGQDRGQAREAGEAGVGGQEQDGHGGDLKRVVEEPAVP